MRFKILILGLIAIMLGGCFSSKPYKKSATIVDKSTYQTAAGKTAEIDIKTADNSALPVVAEVIKPFSKQHLGITFATNPEQKIRAIRDGVVVYSDLMENFGQMIVIKHKFGFYSSYARGKNLRVAQSDKVKKGQIIALTGEQDFYFSMKKFKTPIDPLKYLTR